MTAILAKINKYVWRKYAGVYMNNGFFVLEKSIMGNRYAFCLNNDRC